MEYMINIPTGFQRKRIEYAIAQIISPADPIFVSDRYSIRQSFACRASLQELANWRSGGLYFCEINLAAAFVVVTAVAAIAANAISYLHYITLQCNALHCIALHCTALHCTALHCIALHCIALHCIALHCIALHTLVTYLFTYLLACLLAYLLTYI